jgi:hypothetical protein
VKEAADEIERLNGLVAMQKKDMKVAMDRIAELEGALRWEAGEECENPEGECVVDYPDGPDLWCRYCRIMALGDQRKGANPTYPRRIRSQHASSGW